MGYESLCVSQSTSKPSVVSPLTYSVSDVRANKSSVGMKNVWDKPLYYADTNERLQRRRGQTENEDKLEGTTSHSGNRTNSGDHLLDHTLSSGHSGNNNDGTTVVPRTDNLVSTVTSTSAHLSNKSARSKERVLTNRPSDKYSSNHTVGDNNGPDMADYSNIFPENVNIANNSLPVLKVSCNTTDQQQRYQRTSNRRTDDYDNPRYRIPATRGRSQLVLPSANPARGGLTKIRPSNPERLSITMLDITSAAPRFPDQKEPTNDWMFNTEEDVKKFRKLLQDSPTSNAFGNKNRTNYCDREKTRYIVSWIQNVEETQDREGKCTDTINEVGSTREGRRKITGYVVKML